MKIIDLVIKENIITFKIQLSTKSFNVIETKVSKTTISIGIYYFSGKTFYITISKKDLGIVDNTEYNIYTNKENKTVKLLLNKT